MTDWPVQVISADGRERWVYIWDVNDCGHLFPAGSDKPDPCPKCEKARADRAAHWLLEHPAA